MSGIRPGRLTLGVTGTSELDKLRAEMEAEQAAAAPARALRPQRRKPAPGSPQATLGAAPGAAPGATPGAGAGLTPGVAAGGAPAPARGRPRTGARVAAVQALYQSEHTNEPAEAVIQQFLRHRIGSGAGEGGFEDGHVPEADGPLFSAIVRRVARHAETLDGIIAGRLDADWPLPKLDPVLRALLRAACAELWEAKAPPARVVINEYLDIAHGFFGGEEPRFANGVLDALARALRPGEFARP